MSIQSDDRPKIIAVIPAYNEEKYIGTVVLKARQHVDEVIVVDDGSTDQTADVARLAGAAVIRHQHNKGYGASIQTLLAKAKKGNPNIVVLLDADCQHNPDEIPSLVKPISQGFDLVIGSREQQRGNIPTHRRIGQRVLSYSSRILSGKRGIDTECGFRALSPKAIDKLKLSQNGYALAAEMVAAAANGGLKITQVPVSAIYTNDGSTMNPVTHGLGVLAWIINTISERRPLFFFGLGGSILTALGLIAGFRVLQLLSASGEVATGTALISVLLLTIGIFCIFTGIILNAFTKRKS